MYIRDEKTNKIIDDKSYAVKLIRKFITNVDLKEYPYDKAFNITPEIYFKKVKYPKRILRKYLFVEHKNSLEFRYCLKGKEKLYITDHSNINIEQEYISGRDITVCKKTNKNSTHESLIILKPEDFYLIGPNELHEVEMSQGIFGHETVIFRIILN